ncbi:hypothetical protein AMTR_s00129p00080010 [Amborella trichopoda]|uniref:Uncharacterized protein n=1 Tax=Amborella trichopoda TaxID=13333 RepID=W1NKJ3_AMBTC|nr:hypothetical protein AMTR_s00129p00080010 [Amborella trichopoda]
MEKRVAWLEMAMGDEKDRFGENGLRIEGLEARLEELRKGMLLTLNEAMDTNQTERVAFEDKSCEQWGLGHDVPKVRVLEPKTFNGSRDARELDNFLWQIKRYFKAMSLVDKRATVHTAMMYLTDVATLWGGGAMLTWNAIAAPSTRGMTSKGKSKGS